MRKTKIVSTLGPASESAEMIGRLIEAGVNVFRLNFSHGTHDEHAVRIRRIREEAARRQAPVAILQDLCGPKIRTGQLPPEGVSLKDGDAAILCSADALDEVQARHITGASGAGTPAKIIPVGLPRFAELLERGARVYINDGLIRLQVERIEGKAAVCRVTSGGVVLSRKGINLPGSASKIEAITEKDVNDLKMGLASGVDFVALSFVRKAEDIHRLRHIMEEFGRVVPIIAKIEKTEAVAIMDEIIQAADGVMVARGDLGIEAAIEDVPLIQKRLIRKCNAAGKPVITATQMLESMVESPIPTRAEVTDVANAIFDGTDALMLSQETAVGKHPADVVAMMAHIAERSEASAEYAERLRPIESFDDSDACLDTADAIGHAACQIAKDLKVQGIIACTMSGSTARLVARYRPSDPIYAVTPDEETWRRLSLTWGVWPLLMPMKENSDELIAESLRIVRNVAGIQPPARFVLTAGLPIQQRGITNLIRVITIKG
ncbi:MAG: pyruvate kinase [Candidatus Sumerlaeota bacterium]|nr:pyruvate kinase [Candidatus Sumerlaeota bacterium]